MILSRYLVASFSIAVNNDKTINDVTLNVINNWSNFTPTLVIDPNDNTKARMTLPSYDGGVIYGYTYNGFSIWVSYS